MQKLEAEIERIVNAASDQLCRKFELEDKIWSKKLADIAIKAAVETKMESLTYDGPAENCMDIVKHVKIRVIKTEKGQYTSVLLKGITLEKQLPTKNMITHLVNPQILIVEKSIDMDSFSPFMKF